MSIPLLIVSPHLDDAVLSCGRLLVATPGSVVVTVFAAYPPDARLVEWDAMAGFVAGDDVMGRRRAEDRRALRLLGARPVWLDLPQDVYRDPPVDLAALTTAVTATVLAAIAGAQPEVVAMPLGLHHPDHRLVSELAGAVTARGWVVRRYADQPYASDQPAVLAARLAEQPALQPIAAPRGGRARKYAALRAYRTQLRALGGGVARTVALAPERYWI